jgi:hypothetical protein
VSRVRRRHENLCTGQGGQESENTHGHRVHGINTSRGSILRRPTVSARVLPCESATSTRSPATSSHRYRVVSPFSSRQ